MVEEITDVECGTDGEWPCRYCGCPAYRGNGHGRCHCGHYINQHSQTNYRTLLKANPLVDIEK